MIECMYLGQSGIRLNFNGKIIYIDPYLSNSVKKIEGSYSNVLGFPTNLFVKTINSMNL